MNGAQHCSPDTLEHVRHTPAQSARHFAGIAWAQYSLIQCRLQSPHPFVDFCLRGSHREPARGQNDLHPKNAQGRSALKLTFRYRAHTQQTRHNTLEALHRVL